MSKNKEYELRLIKDFLEFAESSHFIIMEKGSWSSNSMYFNREVKKGDRTVVNINMTMKRPSQDELEHWIEMFLKKYNKNDTPQVLG